MPFIDPYLPYFDSICDEPEFVELLAELESQQYENQETEGIIGSGCSRNSRQREETNKINKEWMDYECKSIVCGSYLVTGWTGVY